MSKQRKKYLIIFLVALGLRLILFFVVSPWQGMRVQERILIVGDSQGYHQIATNILMNKTFSSAENHPFYPNTLRTPVYPLYLSFLYAIFDHQPYVGIFFQLFFGSITCVLTYILAKEFIDERIAFIAGLFVGVDLSSVLVSNMLLTDTLFTLLFIAHIYFLVKFFLEKKDSFLIPSAIFLGLATLCRPVSIYFVIFLAGVFYLQFRKNLRNGAVKYVFLFTLFFLTITPWMFRNYKVANKFLVSSQQEAVFYWNLAITGQNDWNSKDISPQPNEIVTSQRTENSTSPRSENSTSPLTENSSSSKKERPGFISSFFHDMKNRVKNWFLFFIVPSGNEYPILLGLPYTDDFYRDDMLNRPLWTVEHIYQKASIWQLIVIGTGVIYLLYLNTTMFFGVYLAMKSKKTLLLNIFITIIAYFVIATSAAFHARFRVPIMPYMIILSCYGMAELQGRLSVRAEKGSTV